MTDYPTAAEVEAAHATLRKLSNAIYHDPEWEGSSLGAWELVVEARQRLAQAVSACSGVPGYAEAWERMVDSA